MNKALLAILLFTAVSTGAPAQSKVFKEVGEEISSSLQAITQDGALIGYLVFTRLERASEDSFRYKITIMDENLNDIGVVKFTRESMDLKAVSFEQDVLCLAYLKSNMINQNFTERSYKKAATKSNPAVVMQFLNLDGKIISENSTKIVVNTDKQKSYKAFGNIAVDMNLKNPIQVTNIPQKGFACTYGDDKVNSVMAYNTSGQRLWKKNTTEAQGFSMLTTSEDIYLLSKQTDKTPEGGYSIAVYGVNDSTRHLVHDLKDHNDNPLKVLSFANELSTGKPFIAGNIINRARGRKYITGRHLATGAYSGVFTLSFNGHNKADIKETFSYWSDGSLAPAISKKGRYAENNGYSRLATSVRDFEGNTYFIGSTYVKKVKWGTLASCVVLSPLVVVSPLLLGKQGTHKYKVEDAMILKQNAKGSLSFDNVIECNSSRFKRAWEPMAMYDTKRFYQVSNANTKSNYVIVDDTKDIVIYNIGQRKVTRTVPHKEGELRTNIYPAKEGYVMISEYNKKRNRRDYRSRHFNKIIGG